MKKTLVFFCCLVLLTGLCGCKRKDLKSVTVFYTADVQGVYWPRPEPRFDNREVGGYEVLKNFLSQRTEPFLLLDGGNWFAQTPEGTLSKGSYVAKLTKELGYTAGTFSGKDLLYGWPSLQQILRQTAYPFTAANIHTPENTTPAPLKEYIIKEVDGLKIGIFGLVNHSEVNDKQRLSGIRAAEEIQSAKELVEKLKEKNVDAIILLSSLGNAGDDQLTDAVLAEEVPGIDLILSSNLDRENAETDQINNTLIVYPGSKLDSLSQITLFFERHKQLVKTTFEDVVLYKDLYGADPSIAAEVAQLRRETAKKMNAKLTTATEEVNTSLTQESALGNLLTSCLHKWSKLDGAVLNSDSLRSSLPAGLVTEYDLYKVYPYNDNITFITIKGAAFQKALEASLAVKDNFPQVSGLYVEYDPVALLGQKIKKIRIGGAALVPSATYRFAVTDHVMAGGFGHDEFINSLEFKNTFVEARSIMRSCVLREKALSAPDLGRFKKLN